MASMSERKKRKAPKQPRTKAVVAEKVTKKARLGRYTKQNDMAIVSYVAEHATRADASSGEALWVGLEKTGRCSGRTWKSLQQRYLHHLKGSALETEVLAGTTAVPSAHVTPSSAHSKVLGIELSPSASTEEHLFGLFGPRAILSLCRGNPFPSEEARQAAYAAADAQYERDMQSSSSEEEDEDESDSGTRYCKL
jgi:hypothetical protein